MVEHTPVHGIEVPEAGDDPATAAEAIQQFLETVDRLTALRGHETRRPDAGDRGRLFLDTSRETPTLAWDREDTWRSVAGDYNIPPNLARTDQDVTFTGNVEFENTVEADIAGSASEADEADHAAEAESATDFAGEMTVDDFPRADAESEITGEWNHTERHEFADGINVSGGTLDLPTYEESDPPTEDRDQPGFWFRLDHQPPN